MPSIASAAGDAGSVEVRFEDKRVALEARAASLEKILGEVGKLAGFDVVLVEGFHDPGPLDLSFSSLPLEQAVRRLVRDTNHILFFAPGSSEITQVWLLERNSAGAPAPSADADDATDPGIDAADSGTRANAVLRLASQAGADDIDRIQAMLAQIIAGDPDPLVRTRAALALGKTGNEAAVAALAAATRDAHATVRAQAITTLGQIDSIGATEALGEILQDGNRASLERATAARALWRQGNPRAQDFLEIGAADADPLVRQASSKPSAANPPGQRGPAIAE